MKVIGLGIIIIKKVII